MLSLERPANVRILDFIRELIRDEPPRYGWAKFPIGTAAPVTPRWEPAGRWIAYLKREHGLTQVWRVDVGTGAASQVTNSRSEEHTSELQSLMRISYAVFCLKKKKRKIQNVYQ